MLKFRGWLWKIDGVLCETFGLVNVMLIIILACGIVVLYNQPARAQVPNERKQLLQQEGHIDNNDMRLTRLEMQVSDLVEEQRKLIDPSATEHRITAVESQLDTIKTLLVSLLCSTIVLIAESAHRLFVRKPE